MGESNGGGIDRRKLLKIGATTAWVAPAVITSLASPAAAVSTTVIGTACSYVLVVYKNNTTGSVYVTTLKNGVATCVQQDTVGGDVQSNSAAVNGSLAASACSNYAISGSQLYRNGAPMTIESTCRISYIGQTISASAGYSILFTLDHNGSHTGCGSGNFTTAFSKVRFTCTPAGATSVTTCC